MIEHDMSANFDREEERERPRPATSDNYTCISLKPRGQQIAESPSFRKIKLLQISEKKLWKFIDSEISGYPGTGRLLHGTRIKGIVLDNMESLHKVNLELLQELEKIWSDNRAIRKSPLIRFRPIKESQVTREAPPSNLYSKGNYTQQHDLLYRIYKTDARIVRSTLDMHGFMHTDSHTWNIMWMGCTPKPYLFEGLNEAQRINHFPMSYEITRKDKLAYNTLKMQEKFGRDNFDYLPETFILPDEFTEFYAQFHKEKKSMWIVKPTALSRGRGIYLVDNISEVPVEESCIISRYVPNPMLINGLKFDLRVYAVVTSFDPLRIYVYDEGLARFASEPYKAKGAKGNRYMHLTNYSINKKSDKFVQNEDAESDNVGNKWSLSALNKYLEQMGVDVTLLWSKIYDVIIKTLLSAETIITPAVRKMVPYRNNCFELFGFDILIDSDLKPWLVEVNLSPSLANDSPLDHKIKANLISDVLNMVGVRQIDRRKESALKAKSRLKNWSKQRDSYSTKFAMNSNDKRFDSLVRQTFFAGFKENPKSSNNAAGGGRQINSLSDLTNKQKEILKDTLEEYERKGHFYRIFPAKGTSVYDPFFKGERPSNTMLYNALYNYGARNEYFKQRKDVQEKAGPGASQGILYEKDTADTSVKTLDSGIDVETADFISRDDNSVNRDGRNRSPGADLREGAMTSISGKRRKTTGIEGNKNYLGKVNGDSFDKPPQRKINTFMSGSQGNSTNASTGVNSSATMDQSPSKEDGSSLDGRPATTPGNKGKMQLMITGDDVLMEYIGRILKNLRGVDEYALSAQITASLDSFIDHYAWHGELSSHMHVADKLDHRLQEMRGRRKQLLKNINKRYGKAFTEKEYEDRESQKKEIVEEFSPKQLENLLLTSTKNVAQEIVSTLVSKNNPNGVLIDVLLHNQRRQQGNQSISTGNENLASLANRGDVDSLSDPEFAPTNANNTYQYDSESNLDPRFKKLRDNNMPGNRAKSVNSITRSASNLAAMQRAGTAHGSSRYNHSNGVSRVEDASSSTVTNGYRVKSAGLVTGGGGSKSLKSNPTTPRKVEKMSSTSKKLLTNRDNFVHNVTTGGYSGGNNSRHYNNTSFQSGHTSQGGSTAGKGNLLSINNLIWPVRGQGQSNGMIITNHGSSSQGKLDMTKERQSISAGMGSNMRGRKYGK